MKMQKTYVLSVALGIILLGCLAVYLFANPSIQGAAISHNMHHETLQITSESQFIDEMIPHHQEAIDTSRIMLTSQNPKVKDIAQRIITAQEAEIAMMTAWRKNYQTPLSSSYTNMMPDLSKLSGEARDNAFIHGMVMHHQMAIRMANDLLALNPRPELKQLAENIIRTQTQEINEFHSMIH